MIPYPKSVTNGNATTEVAGLQTTNSIDSSLSDEEYILDVGYQQDGAVSIRGGSPSGIFYGLQTFKQLLPPSSLRHTKSAGEGLWALSTQTIHDTPRFAWRGVMLDVARHFMPLPDLLRFIDLLAFHKLNVLHLHLTDDQGWRLPVAKWPELTTVACWRKRTMQGAPPHGKLDSRPHGGYYSREDLEELVAFATERHIRVVPEIDMPGHMQAAVAAYPELGNGAQVVVMEEWGISKHVLNMSDKALEFCKDVLDTVCDIFPGEFIGIGGDECPHDEWKANPDIQSKMKQLGLADEAGLHEWFIGQMAAHLHVHGRRPYGWDELMGCGDKVPKDVLIAAWRGIEPTEIAAKSGFEVIACPDIKCYLDYRQSEDKNEPTPVGVVLSLEDIYNFDPVPEGLTQDEKKKVMGTQVNVWTEHMESASRVNYMVFPRLCAFAEVAWGKADNHSDIGDFKVRLEQHLPRLEALGINYRQLSGPRPWNARPDAPVMHLALLLSLALGLESVVAGPCKPNSFTTTTTATTTESLGLSSTLSTDATKATEQSDSTTTTTLAISESTISSAVGSSALLSDTTALSDQTELTATTTIAVSESTSVTDLGSTTSVASSDISVPTSTEVTSTAVSVSYISTSVLSTSDKLTSSVDASVTTSAPASTTTTVESAGTTEPTTTAESTTDSTAVSSTQISTDTTLEATTTTTTEAPTSTTIVEEVSTTTTLLPIPTLFTLSAQGGPADGLVIHGNGLPDYSVWIGAFLAWPTGLFKYEEGTGHVSVDGNPLCALSYQGNFDFVSVIVCPTTLLFYHAPLVCDRPTDGSLKCSVAVKLYNCVTSNGGTRTCTTADASWSDLYSSAPLYATSGTYYQLRFAAADWAHDSQVSPISLTVTPV
ncbi:hypothetical protein FPRO05_11254 [Fusarium proliferatum]|uniref:beta-N-acetylhexosaminidase n=1 Tax=Gibberella intermedia TaxID=948311 RepID=A0A365N9Q6_GIBIN|nr:hypothetical protein FPRO05_11254 [Fusarium proliferatum]